MNGCVINGTPIAVDFWKIVNCPSAKLFFLTHLHGDHIVGLTSSWRHPIYCSVITAKLLVSNYGIRENLVKPLEIGQGHLLYLDEELQEQMTVTLIDAKHCPGAVMFMFEGYFGKILYTGDFRYHEGIFNEHDEYHEKYSRTHFNDIDDVYLDNTYCDPACVFPSVETATNEIISIIRSHPNCDILIGLRKLGKEDLLLKLALEFTEWVSIPVDMSNTIIALDYPDVFKVEDRTCRIRVVPFHSVTRMNLERLNALKRTIAILPTGLYTGLSFLPYRNCEDIYLMNYSNHSSYSELRKFIKILAPKKIIPIVKYTRGGPFGMSFENRSDMNCFSDLLSGKLRHAFVIPETVRKYMFTRLLKNCSQYTRNSKKRKRPVQLIKQSSKTFQKGVVFEDSLSDDSESSDGQVLGGSIHVENAGSSENNVMDRVHVYNETHEQALDCKNVLCLNYAVENVSINEASDSHFEELRNEIVELKDCSDESSGTTELHNNVILDQSDCKGNDNEKHVPLKKLIVGQLPYHKSALHQMNGNRSVVSEDQESSNPETCKSKLHQMDADCLTVSENQERSRSGYTKHSLHHMNEDCLTVSEEQQRSMLDYCKPASHQMDTDSVKASDDGEISILVRHKPSYLRMDADSLIRSGDKENNIAQTIDENTIVVKTFIASSANKMVDACRFLESDKQKYATVITEKVDLIDEHRCELHTCDRGRYTGNTCTPDQRGEAKGIPVHVSEKTETQQFDKYSLGCRRKVTIIPSKKEEEPNDHECENVLERRFKNQNHMERNQGENKNSCNYGDVILSRINSLDSDRCKIRQPGCENIVDISGKSFENEKHSRFIFKDEITNVEKQKNANTSLRVVPIARVTDLDLKRQRFYMTLNK